MIVGLKTYARNKQTGLPWLNGIPEHWEIKRGKTIFMCIDQRSKTGKEELLTVSSASGVVPRKSASVTMFKAESYVGYKMCWPGDLVINSLWAWAGGLGVSQYHGIISSAYGVYRIKDTSQMIPGFVHAIARSAPFNWELQVRSKGIWTSRLQLTDLAFLESPFVIPPPSEQAAIVRFLNWANGRLDKAIRSKQKVIKLLNEQKQAIINRAVTKGLDSNVKMKDTGVPWLGEIPEHWEIRRLKSITRIRYGLGQPPREAEMGLPLIRATNVDCGAILEKNMVYVDPADVPKTRNAFLTAGEIIVVRSGALTADSAIIPPKYSGAVAGYDMVVTVTKAVPEFISIALLSRYLKNDQLIIASMRAAQPHLNAEELGSAIVLLPSHESQQQIFEYVKRATSPVDETIQNVQHEISLVREYRTRLTADVVTGKLDVREIAKKIPDETSISSTEADELDETDDEVVSSVLENVE